MVGSLRKWYPLPDGGFVASKEPLAGEMTVSEKECSPSSASRFF